LQDGTYSDFSRNIQEIICGLLNGILKVTSETFLNLGFRKYGYISYNMYCLHVNQKVYMTCNFNSHIETEGLLKVTETQTTTL